MEVVAGVIHRGGRVLACQRKEDAPFPLKWEFPGGKVKEGEERVAALCRELQEELAIEIEEVTEIHRGRHIYSRQLQVDLTFFYVKGYHGVLTNLNFQKLLWVEPGRLEDLDFLEADLPLIRRIARRELICFHRAISPL